MKKIFIVLALFAVLLTACTTLKGTGSKVVITTVTEETEGKGTVFESDVRLTTQGFDTDAVTVKKEEGLAITVTEELKGHYLTLDSERITKKGFEAGDKISIPFDEMGSFEIIDETSKSILSVNVE